MLSDAIGVTVWLHPAEVTAEMLARSFSEAAEACCSSEAEVDSLMAKIARAVEATACRQLGLVDGDWTAAVDSLSDAQRLDIWRRCTC